jgi:peroxiredoxin
MFRIVTVLLLCAVAAFTAVVPRPLADVTLEPALGSKKISLSTFRGKVLVVAVVSTSCKPCGTAMGVLNKLQRQYASQPVAFVGAAVGPPESVQQFLRLYRPEFPVGVVNEDEFRKLADSPRPERPFVPMFIFVDKKGTVIAQQQGDPTFVNDLERRAGALVKGILLKK